MKAIPTNKEPWHGIKPWSIAIYIQQSTEELIGDFDLQEFPNLSWRGDEKNDHASLERATAGDINNLIFINEYISIPD